MTITTKSGTTYDLGADADELVVAAAILDKQDLIKPLLEKMYEIGFKEALKEFHILDSGEEEYWL